MIEKWKRALDPNMKVGAIFMDLSKAFDTLNHTLLLTKLKAYGLQPTALKQMEKFLTGRFQRTKVSNSYSSWSELIASVSQGSILGQPLFNIFFNIFFKMVCQVTTLVITLCTQLAIQQKPLRKHLATILESFKFGFTKT